MTSPVSEPQMERTEQSPMMSKDKIFYRNKNQLEEYVSYDIFDACKKLYWTIIRRPVLSLHIIKVLVNSLSLSIKLHYIKINSSHKSIIVVCCVQSLGDIISAEPVARVARREMPGTEIVWCCREDFRDIVRTFADVDRIVTIRCATEWAFTSRMTKTINKIDLQISNNLLCNKCWAKLLKYGKGNAINSNNYYQQRNLLAAQCLAAGIRPIEESPCLVPDANAVAVVDGLDLPRYFVVVHCASNEVSRDWRAEHWRDLARYLAERRGIHVVEVGLKSIATLDRCDRSRSLCGLLSVLETAEVIRRAALFIGIDSGPAHIAHAVGTRGVILLGAYRNFKRYTPYSGAYGDGRLAELVRAEGPVSELDVAPVIEAVDRGLASSRGDGGTQ